MGQNVTEEELSAEMKTKLKTVTLRKLVFMSMKERLITHTV